MRVSVSRGYAEIESLKGDWVALQHHPNVDFEFVIAVCRSRSEVLYPIAVVVHQGSRVAAIIAGRVEALRVRRRVGYLSMFATKACVLNILYQGCLGSVPQAAVQKVYATVAGLLRSEADAICFSHLSSDSLLYQFATDWVPRLQRDVTARANMHWILETRESFDEYMARFASKRRREFRRIQRLIEADYPEAIRWRVERGKAGVSELCHQIEQVMRNTYQRGMGQGFVLNEENVRLLSVIAQKGRLYAALLEVGGRVEAFWVGSVFNSTLYLDFTGYNRDFARYQPGTILLLRVIEDACNSDSVDKIDFGFGDALYKGKFCTQIHEETSLWVFACTYKGMKMKAEKVVADTLSKLLEGIANRMNLRDWVKKRWRSGLAARSRSAV